MDKHKNRIVRTQVLNNDSGLILYDDEGKPISKEWIVYVDNLNKHLQWKDCREVNNISSKLKKKFEKDILESYPDHKWLKEYKALTTIEGRHTAKRKYSNISVWATNQLEAQELFDRMEIDYIKINQV